MTIYYYNKNKVSLGIKEFEVLREKYLVESVSHNSEIKYLETNYDIDSDEYYKDDDWTDNVDVEFVELGIMIHDTRIHGKVYLSYDRDKLKKKYLEDAKEERNKLRFRSRLITQKLKKYENE